MECDNAAWASIALHILKYLISIKTLTVVARHEIPHHQFVMPLKEMVLPVAQPAMGRTEEVRMNQGVCLMHIGNVVLASYH